MGKGSRETGALRTFRRRAQENLEQLELVDAALAVTHQILSQANTRGKSLLKALPISGKYETLHVPAKQYQGMIHRTKTGNVDQAFLRLYAHFTDYLRETLRQAHRERPLELVREAAVDLDPAQAAAADDEEALRRLHFEHAFRNLEVRGDAELLVDRTIEDTGVSIDPSVRNEALMFLEMRNLILYNGGKVDGEYARNFGEDLKVKAGDELPRTTKLGRRGIRGVEKLCLDLDGQLIKSRLVKTA